MLEQRLTLRLIKHWQMARKTNKMPEIQRLNIAAIEDIWPQCILLSATGHSPATYKYEYMGQVLKEIYGRDLTGSYVETHTKKFPGSIINANLPQLIEKPEPINDEGHFVNEQGKIIKYRACLLPIGTDKELTHVVVGLSYRAF